MSDHEMNDDFPEFFDDIEDSKERGEGFIATEGELGMLAKHYKGVEADLMYFRAVYQQWGGSFWQQLTFALRRQEQIAKHLGKEKFRAAIAQTVVKWNEAFKHAKRRDAKFEVCERCNSLRTLIDDVRGDGLCAECAEAAP